MTISRARLHTLFAIALSMLLCVSFARAVAPDKSSRRAGWPPAAARVIHPEPVYVPQDAASQESVLARPAVRGFLKTQPAWKVTVDSLAGGIDRAFGDGLATGAPEAGEAKDAAARRFLAMHADLLAAGLDVSETSLVLDDEASMSLPDSAARIVRLDQRHRGLPVIGAGVTFALREDRVFYVATESLAPIVTSPVPTLTHADALRAVAAYAAVPEDALGSSREPSLAFLPYENRQGAKPRLGHRLIWILEVKPKGARPWEGYIAHVDAHDGTVVAFFPEARNFESCQPVPSEARGSVTGGVRPNRADDPEVNRLLPFVRVDEGTKFVSADMNGRYLYAGGGVASTLAGDVFHVWCDQCSSPVQPGATPDESGVLDFGMGGTSSPPVSGNGFSTPADRTTYFHLNDAYRLMQKWNAAKFSEIDAFVNIDSTCNAFSSGYMLGFFSAGDGCNNTGEIRDVVMHELGHSWDRTDGNNITSGAMSEWKGDVIAVLMGGDSCVGESFHLTGSPTPTCSGVRDLDERGSGPRYDHPPTPEDCPDCFTQKRTWNNCSGEVHCAGEISGQALWHLYNNLRTGVDYVTGLPMPGANPAFTQEQARWFLERWFIGGGAPMVTWDPTVSGTSEYDAVMLADDNDGNLANGTPRAAYINAAFAHHQIAEAVLVPDAANCTPLQDPLVTTTTERDPVTGLPRVRITWTPAGGSLTFDVYRNTRAGDAFLPVVQGVAAGPVFDTGVASGVTYRYFVAAVKKTGCAGVSPGANIASVTVGLPDVQVASRTIAEVPGASDGDGRIEPGERVLVTVALKEAGGAVTAADVSASLSSNDPAFAPIVTGGPVAYGTIPASATVPGPSAFEVLLGPALPCGAIVHQVVSVTGANGCWLDAVDIELTGTAAGCAPSAGAFVEIVPGSATVVAGSGDTDGIADNCETTTVSYLIRNSGTAAASAATGSVSTTHAGMTFAPQPNCFVATLAPGQTHACPFTFSLGSASTTGVTFVATASSAANPAPSRYSFVLPAEANPSTFGTLTYNFDSGLQGWTLKQFPTEFGHYVSSPRSIHAGSTSAAEICAKATSPVLRLSPTSPSTLSMKVWTEIEPSSDAWYDRANVHLIDFDANEHFVLSPHGFVYVASGNPDAGLCHIAGQAGWASETPAWNGATFDLSAWQGRVVQIEVNYSSDAIDNRAGIYVDDITITNAAPGTAPADAQGDGCVVPEVSAPASPVPLRVTKAAFPTLLLAWQDLGPGYQYDVYAGSLGAFYNHGASSLSCPGAGADFDCDGSACDFAVPPATLPAENVYFLVTATAFGVEGTSGQATSGERDPAQNSCVP